MVSVVNKEDIKKTFLDNLKITDKEYVIKVKQELDELEVTYEMGKNQLEWFYSMYINHKDEVGDTNNCNSWLMWALGLTTKKPDSDLIERRYYARSGLPDIDVDYDSRYRDLVKKLSNEAAGMDRMASIGTDGTLKLRSAFSRVAKGLDLAEAYNKGKTAFTTENEALVREILNTIPETKNGKLRGKINLSGDKDFDKEIDIVSINDAYKCLSSFRFYIDKYKAKNKDLLFHTSILEGGVCQRGVHAAGTILTHEDFKFHTPLFKNKDSYGTQFTADDVESLGFIKFDFLGLLTLSVLDYCVKLIKKRYDINIDIDNLPLDDKKTLELYRSGKLCGVFQCENHGMQESMVEIQPDRFEDISAVIALYRPGPMAYVSKYAAVKNGRENPDYFHPSIEKFTKPILGETYGIMVYQEDLMAVCQSLGKLDLIEAYDLIKGVSKKKIEIIEQYEKKFIKGALENGVDEKVSKMYWDRYIIPFANYSFNKAHSAFYGGISHATAYLKAHYPLEYFCSLLNITNEEKNKNDKVIEIIKDLKNFNIVLGEKKINECSAHYDIVQIEDPVLNIKKSVISPALMVKGIGQNAAEELSRNKPYKDIRDIAVKTKSNLVTKEAIQSLGEDGFFEAFKKMFYKKNKKRLSNEDIVAIFVQNREDNKKMDKFGIKKQEAFSMID